MDTSDGTGPAEASRKLTPGNPGAEPLPWPAPGPGPANADSPTDVDRPLPTTVGGAGPAPVSRPGPAPEPIPGDAPDSPPDHPTERELEQLEMDTARAGGRRGSGWREAVGSLVTRVTAAEREMRSAEDRAAAARASAASDERREEHSFSPFKAGLYGGVGLLLAYMAYLSLDTIRSTLIVIAVALLLAIGLDPAVRWLQRRARIPRGGGVAIVFLLLLAVIAGTVYAIVPPVVTQLGAFIENLPQTLTDLQERPWIQRLDQKFGLIEQIQKSDFISNIGSEAAPTILSSAAVLAGIVVDLFIVLILTLYFLASFPRIKASAYRLAPASQRARATDLGDKILKQMGGYLSGATVIALQAGTVAGVFAWIVDLPYPWAIALGAAVLDFIPVIGPIIIGLGMTLLGLTQSLTLAIVAGGFYLLQHLFEAYWLYPRVMRRAVHISSGSVIVAILIGGALLGVTGALLAVPLAAATQLIVREVVMPMQERK